MRSKQVLFLCPHGAAKSVLAAAYLQQMAEARGLNVTADFAGTDPDDIIMPVVVSLLAEEGVTVPTTPPHLVTDEELTSADHVVSIGCTVEALPVIPSSYEEWENIPPVSQNPSYASEIIRTHVNDLLHRLVLSP